MRYPAVSAPPLSEGAPSQRDNTLSATPFSYSTCTHFCHCILCLIILRLKHALKRPLPTNKKIQMCLFAGLRASLRFTRTESTVAGKAHRNPSQPASLPTLNLMHTKIRPSAGTWSVYGNLECPCGINLCSSVEPPD